MSESQEPELLPCPFCGGEAEYEIYGEENEYDKVKCKKCGFWFDAPNYDVSSREIWNRRVPAAGQWTKEPPKESGFYAVHFSVIGIYDARFLDDEQYMKEKSRQEKIDFVQKSLSIAYPGALWCKLDVPPLPEGKESKE